jgi:ribonuclease HI
MLSSIYTDGSSLGNPGPSGWSFCVLENNEEFFLSGGEEHSTNNRMELYSIIQALKYVKGTEYILYSDSNLTINCAKKIWKRKANIDLWDIYDEVSKNKKIDYIWIKSHNGNKYNEIVDKLARKEANKINIHKKL